MRAALLPAQVARQDAQVLGELFAMDLMSRN